MARLISENKLAHSSGWIRVNKKEKRKHQEEHAFF
jgi:hypothetical protein